MPRPNAYAPPSASSQTLTRGVREAICCLWAVGLGMAAVPRGLGASILAPGGDATTGAGRLVAARCVSGYFRGTRRPDLPGAGPTNGHRPHEGDPMTVPRSQA